MLLSYGLLALLPLREGCDARCRPSGSPQGLLYRIAARPASNCESPAPTAICTPSRRPQQGLHLVQRVLPVARGMEYRAQRRHCCRTGPAGCYRCHVAQRPRRGRGIGGRSAGPWLIHLGPAGAAQRHIAARAPLWWPLSPGLDPGHACRDGVVAGVECAAAGHPPGAVWHQRCRGLALGVRPPRWRNLPKPGCAVDVLDWRPGGVAGDVELHHCAGHVASFIPYPVAAAGAGSSRSGRRLIMHARVPAGSSSAQRRGSTGLHRQRAWSSGAHWQCAQASCVLQLCCAQNETRQCVHCLSA
jgi:hypothetical protein